MASNGGFADARPASGDLVDRYLEARLRRALFGASEEIRLGRLRIEGPLGSGGMGTVVLASDPLLDRHVAIKSVRPERPADGDRLLAEARLVAKLDHENIVRVHDVVSEDGTVHIVMERVDGESLRAWMSEPRPWQQVVPLFIKIGHGLAAAHDLDIAHCDVKPVRGPLDRARRRPRAFGRRSQRGSRAPGGRVFGRPRRPSRLSQPGYAGARGPAARQRRGARAAPRADRGSRGGP
jgi:hypothetical protein